MNIIQAEILTIGDELLYGQVLDTNAHWICGELDKNSIKIVQRTTIGDTRQAILTALSEAEERADIILITGGLGPTSDDLTKPCLVEYFNTRLVLNPEALNNLEGIYKKLGREISALNRGQAELPETCTMVPNLLGSASGMWLNKKDKTVVSMPGVPHEMKQMMRDTVVPWLVEKYRPPAIYHKIIRTVGIGESDLSEIIHDWETNLPDHIKLAYLPGLAQVRLRLTAMGSDMKQVQNEVTQQIQKLLPLARKYIFGYDKEELRDVIGRLLQEKKKTVALAESCTGGYVSHQLTSVPGSSAYYQGSIIPYHNDLKIKILGIKEATIAKHGAVSEETVTEMAERVREIYSADYGLATSGIAGPGGGSVEKPVGTVWIAVADGKQTKTRKLQLWKDRDLNIKTAAIALFNQLRQRILEID